MTGALKIRPAAPQRSRLERIRSLIRDEFADDDFLPPRGDPVYRPACRGMGKDGQPSGCEAIATNRLGLCRTHMIMLQEKFPESGSRIMMGRPPEQAAAFLADPEANRPIPGEAKAVDPIQLGDLPEELKAELQLFFQEARDQEMPMKLQICRKTVRALREAGVESIYARSRDDEDSIANSNMLSPDSSWIEGDQNVHQLVRRMMRTLAFRISDRPVTERRSWRQADFAPATAAGRWQTSSFTFDFALPWFEDAVRRYMKHELETGRRSFNTICVKANGLRKFDRYLAQLSEAKKPAGMDGITRQHLVGYISWQRRGEQGSKMHQRNLADVRLFLDTWRDLAWEPALQPDAALRLREAKAVVEKPLPKPLSEHLLAQVTSERVLSRIDPQLARMIIIARYHGLRPSSLVSLGFDCLRYNGQGDTLPVLRYQNVKSHREAEQPVYHEAVVQAIRDQQQSVLAMWPEGSPWLFPAITHNASGSKPRSTGSITTALRKAQLLAKEPLLTHQDGSRAYINWYSFRDTVATEMLNRGLPSVQVAAWLDHSDVGSLEHYCRVHAETLRRAIDTSPLLNIKGEDMRDSYAESAGRDIEVMRQMVNMGRTAFGGTCTLTIHEKCPHHMRCLSCDHFATGPDHLPEHLAHLERAIMMDMAHTSKGHIRLAEEERDTIRSLTPIVEMLDTWPQQHPEDATPETHAWKSENQARIEAAIAGGRKVSSHD